MQPTMQSTLTHAHQYHNRADELRVKLTTARQAYEDQLGRMLSCGFTQKEAYEALAGHDTEKLEHDIARLDDLAEEAEIEVASANRRAA